MLEARGFKPKFLITKITHTAQTEQITPQQVIAIAFKRSDKLDQVQQDYVEAVAEVRDVQIQLQRENIQKDERINDLSQQLVQRDNRIEDLENLLASVSPKLLTTLEMTESSLTSTTTWEDVAQSMNCSSEIFLNAMKTWSKEQKEALPRLLAEYIEVNHPECLDELGWIPDKLRDAALKQIPFAVQKIVGADNLVDEPELKTFYGCTFVSLRGFSTRQERWLFQAKDGKQLPCFGREEFSINRF